MKQFLPAPHFGVISEGVSEVGTSAHYLAAYYLNVTKPRNKAEKELYARLVKEGNIKLSDAQKKYKIKA